MINIDMWHNDKIKAVEKINIFFNDLTGEYWGNCYINNKAIGDYTADSSTDIEKAFVPCMSTTFLCLILIFFPHALIFRLQLI